MSETELQEEEREVLLSIYDGDDCFKQITPTSFQYKFGKDNDAKSFVVEIRWGEQYPQAKPDVFMESFYNKDLGVSVKAKIVTMLLEESEQYLGMSMTYSLFEFIKEKFEGLIAEQPEEVLNSDVCDIDKVVITEQNEPKKLLARKEQLTKGQKRRQWDKSDNKGEKPRGWNWVDIVKHLSQTGNKPESLANATSAT